jgi:hypothetical protein
MLNMLLTGKDWTYAAIMIKETEPMFIEREICKSTDHGTHVEVFVPDGPHPFKEGLKADATHFVSKSDIIRVSYYKDKPAALIQAPSGASSKKGKIITS